MYIILYLIFFGFYFWRNYRVYQLNSSSFILLIYLVSSTCGFFLLVFFDAFDESKVTFISVSFHIICLYFFLSPVVCFGNIKTTRIKFPSYLGMKILAMFVILFSLLTIVVYSSKVAYVFTFDSLKQARLLYNERALFDESSSGLFEYLGSFGHIFSFFAIFICFHFLVNYPKDRLFIFLLFLSSTSIIFYNLSAMGREGIVRWILYFIFCFLYFKDLISPRLKRRIVGYSVLSIIPVVAVFVAISVSRFGDRDESVLYSIVSYSGQSFVYFSYRFDEFFGNNFGGRLYFPILFPDSERVFGNNLNDVLNATFHLNTFATFVGSFYIDIGLMRTFFLSLFFYLSFTYLFRISSHRFRFSRFVLFIIMSQVIILGIFYFMFYSPTVVKSLMVFFLLSVFVQYKFPRKFYIK